jgi:SAM-dependent methyltransferase
MSHPLYARRYARSAPRFEDTGPAAHRQRLLSGVTGVVLEIGAGIGLNFSHYPETVSRLYAVEPEPYLRRAAAARASGLAYEVDIVEGAGESLSLPDSSVDCVVLTLTLCSVHRPSDVLAESRRVLRPNGILAFYEHVAASTPALFRRQRALDTVWAFMSGGCHLTRQTEHEITNAGFSMRWCDRFHYVTNRVNILASPHILGWADK